MHHARLSKSPRLQRALRVMRAANGEISTYELSRRAEICAVNSVIAELRANGAEIDCRQDVSNGERRFFYTLISAPEDQNATSKID